ncbi:MAG: SMC family ATPase [Anaerolineales bacterium]|nr:SMC family ATPase [Anaerolineales bacterium]
MIPLQLTISGFLSYRDPIELDFTTFDLACIAGPNGAGKSSLLDAITWVLFGQARKRDDSLINSHPDTQAAEVSLTFAYEGNIYRVQRIKPRDKTAVLEFQILQDSPVANGTFSPAHGEGSWKPLTERSLRETEACIRQTLQLDYETFVNASFFLQGKADQFTQQRPGDRKRILGSILGLEVWETYRRRALSRRREVETEIDGLEGRLDEIRRELNEEGIRITRLEELQAELERLSETRMVQESTLDTVKQVLATLAEQAKLVTALGKQMDAASRRFVDLETRLRARREERQDHAQVLERADDIEKAYTAWEQAREDLERWDEISALYGDHEKRRQAPLSEINAVRASLEQELKTLREQSNTAEAASTELGELKPKIMAIQESVKGAEVELEGQAQVDAEREAVRQRQAEAKAENPRLKAEMDELKARIDQLSAAEGAECPTCGQPLSLDERNSLINTLEAEGKEMGDRYRENTVYLKEVDQQVRALDKQINDLKLVETAMNKSKQALTQLTSREEVSAAHLDEWQAKGAPRLSEVQVALKEESFAPQARELLAEVDAELKDTGYDAAAHDRIRREESEGRAAAEERRALDKAKAALEPLDREVGDLEKQAQTLQDELTQQQKEYDQAAATLAAAQAQAPDHEAAENELFKLQEQENRVRLEVGAARQKVDVLKGLKERRQKLKMEREELAARVGQYKQIERAFGKDGVPALLIEQMLPQIEAKANEILERLSDGMMSVRFVTQARFKDKHREDMKETLEIQISDSAGVRDYELYSGGEAFRVNFAIRLALSEVLAQRAGARLQTLVIDEGFGSQDALGRQRLVEAINLVRQDFAKIPVITHIDELKDAFPTRIEVEKGERGSVVVVI